MINSMKPMLLHRYHSGCKAWPYWAERKHNGVRCLIVSDGKTAAPYSREGNLLPSGYVAAGHIMATCGPGVYDGELVAGTFTETLSAVKRKTTAGVRFKVWDCLTLEEWDRGVCLLPLPERRARLVGLLAKPTDPAWYVCEIVTGRYICNHADLFYAMAEALRRGWEGLVLKDPAAPYLCGERTWGWLKCKDLGAWS